MYDSKLPSGVAAAGKRLLEDLPGRLSLAVKSGRAGRTVGGRMVRAAARAEQQHRQ